MRIHIAAAAAVSLTVLSLLVLPVFGRSLPVSGTPASSSKGVTRHGIFDIATSKDTATQKQNSNSNAGKSGSRTGTGTASPFGTATASPFGTASPRKVSDRRWKSSCKISDCIQNKAIPANSNLTLGGKVVDVVTDGRYTIVKMFDSVSIRLENGAQADVPVTFTVVMDAESATEIEFKPDTKKNFTLDSNYAYLVWDDEGCSVRAVHNSLTEQDDVPATTTKR